MSCQWKRGSMHYSLYGYPIGVSIGILVLVALRGFPTHEWVDSIIVHVGDSPEFDNQLIVYMHGYYPISMGSFKCSIIISVLNWEKMQFTISISTSTGLLTNRASLCCLIVNHQDYSWF